MMKLEDPKDLIIPKENICMPPKNKITHTVVAQP